MRLPLQITFRDIPPSEAIETAIRDKAMKLERYFDRITSMRVTVSAPHKSQTKGKLYDINIDITVPGQEIVVSHDKHDEHSHEDLYVSLRDAFTAAQRQLETYVGKMRGEVKTHDVPAHGRVVEVTPDSGTILTSDGREIYFHRNSLLSPLHENTLTSRLKWHPVQYAKRMPWPGKTPNNAHLPTVCCTNTPP